MLNKLPKSQHSKAKRALQEIWMAETTELHADSAFDAFIVDAYAVKYDKERPQCLVKDRRTRSPGVSRGLSADEEHWKHLRTSRTCATLKALGRHPREHHVLVRSKSN